MTILFASDLDQTLIYSRRSMGPEVREKDLREVERFEGKPQSFMTEKSQQTLWELSDSAFFLPVTTRTQAQYERVTGIFKEGETPQFAIISNGAVILENGEPIQGWSEQMRAQCISDKTVVEELMPKIAEHFSEDWVLRVRQADGWFVYLIIDRERFPAEKLDEYIQIFHAIGWDLSLQGRKLYFMPVSITKAGAMEYVKQRINADFVAAAGDSLLDHCLLESADLGFLAAHGEVARSNIETSDHIEVTSQSGIKAGEEILDQVTKLALQYKG